MLIDCHKKYLQVVYTAVRMAEDYGLALHRIKVEMKNGGFLSLADFYSELPYMLEAAAGS